MTSEYITVAEAAKLASVSRQTMFCAIRKHVLRYKIIKGMRYTKPEWVNDYMSNRHNRQRVYFNGKPLFDYMKGEWSVKMTACHMQCTIQHVHFLIRAGKLTSFRRGSYHVIPKSSIEKLLAEKKEKVA